MTTFALVCREDRRHFVAIDSLLWRERRGRVVAFRSIRTVMN